MFINKRSKAISAFIAIVVLVLACAPRVGFDTEAYSGIFELLKRGDHAALSVPYYKTMHGYFLLIQLANNIGIDSFYLFKFVTLSLLGFIAYKTIGKEICNKTAFFFFYLISTFSNDAIQHRNSVALLLLMIGLHYLLTDPNKGKVKFSVFVGLAMSIHFTYGIYFLLIFIKRDMKKTEIVTRRLLYGTLFFCAVFAVNRGLLDNIATMFIWLLKNEKLTHYFYNRINWGFITPLFLSTSMIVILHYCQKKIECDINFRGRENTNDLLQFIKKVKYINIMIYPTCILLLFSLSIYRVMRNLMPLNIIAVTNFFSRYRHGHDIRLLHGLTFSVLCLLNIIYFNFILGPASDILYAVWDGKMFFAP